VDEWDEDDEMGVAGAFVMGFLIVFTVTVVTGVAIVWNVASLAAEGVRALRR
jgi:hypothetical protein